MTKFGAFNALASFYNARHAYSRRVDFMSHEAAAARLMEALNFDTDDLARNREGRLSARQLERLRQLRGRSVLIGMGIILLIGFAAALIVFLSQRNNSPILLLVGIGVTICNAALTGILARNWLRLNADIRAGEVASVSGSVHHTIRVAGRVAQYLLRVDGIDITVSKPVFLAVAEGKPYRFYRAPASRVLLSAEDKSST